MASPEYWMKIMGRKSRLKADKRHRIARALREPLPSYIDLVDYVQFRTKCSRRTAIKVILAGALTVDGKPVGYIEHKDQKVLSPFLPSGQRSKIVVETPEILK